MGGGRAREARLIDVGRIGGEDEAALDGSFLESIEAKKRVKVSKRCETKSETGTDAGLP
jgi:hypothetical protein